jgi:GNAT superfamily N-acetyltransferase
MNKIITYHSFQPSSAKMINQLIRRVYDEFVAPDYDDEGNQFFYDWISPEKIVERQCRQQTLWYAIAGDEIVGMIEMRQNDHISLLFVDKSWQGKGIARELFRLGMEQSMQRDPGIKKMYVHASPFSIPVYEKLGFMAVGEMMEQHGISYLPMEMELEVGTHKPKGSY